MKHSVYLSEEELVRRAVNALSRELGPVEATRFLARLRQIPTKRIESVKRHRKWQTNLDPQAFFDEVFGVAHPTKSGCKHG